jgi:RHS repeat-associated protein
MNGENDTMYYIHKDYLGSYDVITNESGTVMERLSFDPWGRRRNPADWTYDNIPARRLFDRGYTGHEHLDVFGLINMNGRAYDPWLGRFLSPDPFVQSPGNSQSYNRYSYCLNNPLKYVDPSGYLLDRHPWDWSKTTGNYWIPNGVYSGMIGQGSGNHWSDAMNTSGSTYCSYNYDWNTGQYYNKNGEVVSWNEVFVNYVEPNSVGAPYFYYLQNNDQIQNYQPQKANPQQNINSINYLTDLHNVLFNKSGMMFFGTLEEILEDGSYNQSIEDGRVDLLNSVNPIYEILEMIAINNSAGNLFDLIIPNYYGRVTMVGRCYSNVLSLAGREYKIFVLGYNEYVDRSFYDLYKWGFGYLDPFSNYKPSPDLNGGYSVGFYMQGYYGLNLITIGAKNEDDYNYLISLYNSIKYP